MATCQGESTPPSSIWATLPGEILYDIYDFILAQDHTRRDTVALFKVNRRFNRLLKKRMPADRTLDLVGGEPHYIRSGYHTYLPSMVICLVLGPHGLCSHLQQHLGLTSPNLNLRFLFIDGCPGNSNRECNDLHYAVGHPTPCMSQRSIRAGTLVLADPHESSRSPVHESIVQDSVEHLVYMLHPSAFEDILYLMSTPHTIPAYHSLYTSANKATIVFQPLEEDFVADDDEIALHHLYDIAVEIFRLLDSFQTMMLRHTYLSRGLTVVNAGDLHIRIISYFANGLLIESAQDRQDALQRWLAGQVERCPCQIRGPDFPHIVRFLTMEEWYAEM